MSIAIRLSRRIKYKREAMSTALHTRAVHNGSLFALRGERIFDKAHISIKYSKPHNKFLFPSPAKAIYGSFCRAENEIFNVVNYSILTRPSKRPIIFCQKKHKIATTIVMLVCTFRCPFQNSTTLVAIFSLNRTSCSTISMVG